MQRLQVNLPAASYSITIGAGLLSQLGDQVLSLIPSATRRQALLAVDSQIARTHGMTAAASLASAGISAAVHPVHASESEKSIRSAELMWKAMLDQRLERGGIVVALGGGTTGDLAGFAASTWMRGVPVVQVPTTLLAMVDASIGGKTAINLALPDGDLAKNMVGSFWQPRAVLADVATLKTLEPRHVRCGLAECIKHGMLGDPKLIDFIERQAQDILTLREDVLIPLVARAAAVKVGIVQQDERETGRRALLNLGHTFGHAIEGMPELGLLHGEAVSIGLVAAMRCAVETGRMGREEAGRLGELLARLGLPRRVERPVTVARVLQAMSHDKKVAGGKLRLVLPVGLGNAALCDDVPETTVMEALREIGAAP